MLQDPQQGTAVLEQMMGNPIQMLMGFASWYV